jgi:hypothetical protein
MGAALGRLEATGRLEVRTMATAYDYDRQEWVTGPKAAALLRKQYNEELAILQGPDAEGYLRMIGSPDTPQEAIVRLAAKYGI